MAIKKLKHITVICRELYEEKGASAVYDYMNDYMDKYPDTDVLYKQCTGCEASTPHWHGECLICGSPNEKENDMGKVKELMYGDTIENVQQLNHIMSTLDDHDQLTLVTCDEYGDEQDHYPMAIDVIDNIRLTDDTIVREVQFIQRPNSEPDTRDKQPLVDALIDVLAEDIEKGDTTVLDELLLRMPYEVLKYALPEDMWEDFPEKV